MNKLLLSREQGFTILEVVFAVSILAIGIMGYTALKTSNMYSWFFSKNMSQAVQLTGSNLEAMWMAGYNDDGWLSPADSADPHTDADANDFGDTPVLNVHDFTASGVEWTVRDQCPSELTKMVAYTTKWSDNNNSVTITQVQVRP
jgi:prepilin-type N-terminal cleavage/methylation domain-containing protein